MVAFSGTTRRERTRAPTLVQWMATIRCPLSCEHCLSAASGNGFADMPLARVLNLVDECAEIGVAEFLVTGGEPCARRDLPEVIERLAARSLSWSINTAAMPSRELRDAMTEHPPNFAAVSLDGPEDIHDLFRGRRGAFRESLESIRFFKSLPGTRVCAGTTLTSRNFPHIEETFLLAAAGGADSWGLHLLVPEGRAASRRDLFLSRAQIKKLLRFAAAKRHYFPVEMADEIGYVGAWEPLVRDAPLLCGAGRAQCVVLPDGSVVPCTTLDRSTAAGNINETSLREIWEHGDWPMRKWTPSGKCARCEDAIACGGGCWLQRRKGTECFKDAWHLPAVLKTAAGVAVCMGMTAAGPAPETAPRPAVASVIRQDDRIEDRIFDWYLAKAGYRAERISKKPETEPARAFFNDFAEGKLPKGIAERAGRVQDALKTEERSLALAALMWRTVTEPLLEGGPRTAEEKQRLRETLAANDKAATEWRAEIYTKKLDRFLTGDNPVLGKFFKTKAGPRPNDLRASAMWIQQGEERWAWEKAAREEVGGDPAAQKAKDLLDKAPPVAAHLLLPFLLPDHGKLELTNSAGTKIVEEKGEIGIFDVLVVPKQDAPVVIRIDWNLKFTLKDEAPHADVEIPDVADSLDVNLPPGEELTWMDVVRLADEQHRDALDKVARAIADVELRKSAKATGFDDLALSLLVPAIRRMEKEDPKPEEKGNPASKAKRLLIEFWMF